jgi:formylglycine-generating enzyme required for sulfatase activity
MKKLFLFCTSLFLLLSAFNTKKKSKLKLPDEFVLIPAGTYYAATPEEDPYYYGMTRTRQGKDSSKIESISSFYISKYEITNLRYRQFYNEVSPGLTEGEKEKIACDTLGWRQELTYQEPMVDFYYRHPVYNNFPVSNISYEGAVKYCEWLQQKIQKENPGFNIEVKLPEKHQWIWAAMGGRTQAMYPWANWYLRNKKGEYLCNFKTVGDYAIVRNRQTGKPEVHDEYSGLSDKAFYTAEVRSFYPNDYGLYNMCGNAAEMVNEKGIAMGGSWNDYGGDVHIKAEAKYKGSAPTVGFRPIIIVIEKTAIKN